MSLLNLIGNRISAISFPIFIILSFYFSVNYFLHIDIEIRGIKSLLKNVICAKILKINYNFPKRRYNINKR